MRGALLEHLPRARYTGLEVSEYLCDRYGWQHGSVVSYAAGAALRPRDLLRRAAVPRHARRAGARLRNLARLCRGRAAFQRPDDRRLGACTATGGGPTATSTCAEPAGIGDDWRRTSSMRAAGCSCARRPTCSSGSSSAPERGPADDGTIVPPVIPRPEPDAPVPVAIRRRRACCCCWLAATPIPPATLKPSTRRRVERPRLQLPGTLAQSERMAPLVIPPPQREAAKLDPAPHCLDEPPPYFTRKASTAAAAAGASTLAMDSAEDVVHAWAVAWSEPERAGGPETLFAIVPAAGRGRIGGVPRSASRGSHDRPAARGEGRRHPGDGAVGGPSYGRRSCSASAGTACARSWCSCARAATGASFPKSTLEAL